MEAFFQEGTMTLPTIDLNPNSGLLKIIGRSIPEHPVKFYQPVDNWVTEYVKGNPSNLEFIVHLDYLNTHSTECLLLIMKKLEEYYKASAGNVIVKWKFDEDDEDMETLGQDLSSLVNLPFTIQEVKD